MPTQTLTTTTLSAPGKVLLCGGYLILDRLHRGLIFSLSARIHVCVQPTPKRTNESGQSSGGRIVVKSPQFLGAEWVYEHSVSEGVGGGAGNRVGDGKGEGRGAGVDIRQIEESKNSTSRNPFVETTLLYVLTYLDHLPVETAGNLSITILADDDYYSHDMKSATKGGFSSFGVSLADAHKTGLGSSAALVTALTAALVVAFLPEHDAAAGSGSVLGAREDVIHNLAQAAHCAAQGKVGSGFDVAAAVYGSCLYRRFTPSVLGHVGEAGSEGFGERLHRCVENLDPDHRWDTEVAKQAVQIPSSLRLVMCDVDCGSQTPGMVKKVLAWRKERPEEASLLWSALQQGTEDFCKELTHLAQLEGIARTKYQNLRHIILTIRSLVREMSQKSGVAIEPPLQTELLDACSAIPGLVGGVVPGAGGYDAVVLLAENNEEVLAELQNLLDRWKGSTEQGSGVTIGKVSLLGVKQDVEGIKIEEAGAFAGWI